MRPILLIISWVSAMQWPLLVVLASGKGWSGLPIIMRRWSSWRLIHPIYVQPTEITHEFKRGNMPESKSCLGSRSNSQRARIVIWSITAIYSRITSRKTIAPWVSTLMRTRPDKPMMPRRYISPLIISRLDRQRMSNALVVLSRLFNTRPIS